MRLVAAALLAFSCLACHGDVPCEPEIPVTWELLYDARGAVELAPGDLVRGETSGAEARVGAVIRLARENRVAIVTEWNGREWLWLEPIAAVPSGAAGEFSGFVATL